MKLIFWIGQMTNLFLLQPKTQRPNSVMLPRAQFPVCLPSEAYHIASHSPCSMCRADYPSSKSEPSRPGNPYKCTQTLPHKRHNTPIPQIAQRTLQMASFFHTRAAVLQVDTAEVHQ